MPITYGSVGDIIATVQVAAQLLEAINATRGAARQSREIVSLLQNLHAVLDQLMLFWPTRSDCPQLDILHAILLPFTNDCRSEIETFLERIMKVYGENLSRARTDGSRRTPKDIGKMIRWQAFEGDAVASLKEKLQLGCEVINMVYMRAQGIAEEKNHEVIDKKLDIISRMEEELDEKLELRLADLESKLDRNTEYLRAAISPIEAISADMKNMVLEFSQQVMLSRSMTTTTNQFQEIVQLEDLLGVVLPIHLETVGTWEILTAVLNNKFINRPGHELVKTGRYVLYDAASGRDLSTSKPFTASTGPGRKIKMAMVFYSAEMSEETARICPGCKTIILSSKGNDMECQNPDCKMEFRRAREDSWTLDTSAEGGQETALCRCRDDEEEDYHIENDVPSHLLERFRRLHERSRQEDSPDVFKRVRFITRWQDMLESRGYLWSTWGKMKAWYPEGYADHINYQIFMNVSDLIFMKKWFSGTIVIEVLFVGESVQHSHPVMFLYHKEKRTRQRVLRSVKTLGWLQQSGIPVVTCSGPEFEWVEENGEIVYEQNTY